jgi:hypothetical protein
MMRGRGRHFREPESRGFEVEPGFVRRNISKSVRQIKAAQKSRLFH